MLTHKLEAVVAIFIRCFAACEVEVEVKMKMEGTWMRNMIHEKEKRRRERRQTSMKREKEDNKEDMTEQMKVPALLSVEVL